MDELLTLNDKLFILNNKNLFDDDFLSKLPDMSSILYDAYGKFGQAVIYGNFKNSLKSRYIRYCFSIPELRNLFDELMDLKCFTFKEVEENIRAINKIINNLIYNNKKFSMNLKNDIISCILEIISYKLNALIINEKISTQINPSINRGEILNDLFRMLFNSDDSTSIAIIYLILFIINEEKSQEKTCEYLVLLYRYILYTKGKCDIKDVTILQDVSKVLKLLNSENGLFLNFIMYNTPIDKNNALNTHSIVASMVNKFDYDDDLLFIPDKNNKIEVTQFLKKKLHEFTPELLESYTGSKALSFSIPDNIIGYFLYNDMCIGKAFYRTANIIYTILNDGNDNYVLFISKDRPDRCYGLSILEDIENNRKLFKAVIPSDNKYELLDQ